jgi:hypothetical protein
MHYVRSYFKQIIFKHDDEDEYDDDDNDDNDDILILKLAF